MRFLQKFLKIFIRNKELLKRTRYRFLQKFVLRIFRKSSKSFPRFFSAMPSVAFKDFSEEFCENLLKIPLEFSSEMSIGIRNVRYTDFSLLYRFLTLKTDNIQNAEIYRFSKFDIEFYRNHEMFGNLSYLQ